MKKRLISLLLTLTTVFSMIPMLGVGVEAKMAVQMTEAEAWQAGVDVYMAWYNNIKMSHVEDYYKDSHFTKLFEAVYPTIELRDERISQAYDYCETHMDLDFGGDTALLQYRTYMAMLFTCFYYYDNVEDDGFEKFFNLSRDQLDVQNSIFSNSLIQSAIDAYFENEWAKLGGPIVEEPPEILLTGDTWLTSTKIVPEAVADALGALASGAFSYFNIRDAAKEAGKLINLGLLNDEYADIVLHLATKAADPELKKAATSLYGMISENSNEFFKDLLVKYTAAQEAYTLSVDLASSIISDSFFPMASAAAKAGGGLIAVAGPEFVGGLALGLIIANLMEESVKAFDDLMIGKKRNYVADLELYFMYIIRESLHTYYSECLRKFKEEPNQYNARELNSIAKLMWNVLLCENDYAGQCEQTYCTAGILKIGQVVDILQDNAYTNFMDMVDHRRDRLKDRRSEYTFNSLKAYSDFAENHVHTVHFDTNGGSYVGLENVGLESKQGKIDTIPLTLPKVEPTFSGHKFLGWATSRTAKVPEYSAGDTYIADGDATLYAVWVKANTVTYDPQNGSVSPSSSKFLTGESVKLPIPTRVGYEFLGWSADKTASNGEYDGGKTYTFEEGDITLYAIWKPGVFDIVYHANEGKFPDGSTEIVDKKVYNESYKIDVDEPIREGYKFSGKWSSDKDGIGKYDHGVEYTSIGGPGLSPKHLYAVWEDSEYEVTYDYNNAADPLKEYAYPEIKDTTYYTIAFPSINTSAFKGWMYMDPAGTYT